MSRFLSYAKSVCLDSTELQGLEYDETVQDFYMNLLELQTLITSD